MKTNNVLPSNASTKSRSRLSFAITAGMTLVLLGLTAGLLIDDGKPVLRTALLMAAGVGTAIMSFALYPKK